MNRKQLTRMLVDLAMTVVLLLLMGYSRIGEEAHEWLGVGMTVLFILHHILNRKWIAALFRGRYGAYRVVQTILVCLALISLCGSAVSGIMLSKHIFRFLGIEAGMSFARELHMLCGYWNLVLLSLHLGLHWIVIVGMIGKKCKNKSDILKWGARLLAAAIAVYGVYALIARQVADYLFGTVGFAFFDPDEPVILFLLDYLAVMGLFVSLGHYGAKLLRSAVRKQNKRN